MNKEQKAAVVEKVAADIQESDAIIAVDYRGISVKQAGDLRTSLRDADARFTIVKNTLTERAADKAGADALKPLLEGPTALTFVRGDVALAAKALARFRRENGLLEWKGGQMDGNALTPDEIEALSRLPAREQLHAQLVGVVSSPLTTLVRGLASMISGLASQLQQIADQGLVGGADEPTAGSPQPTEEEGGAAEETPAEEEAPPAEEETPSEAPGDPVAEAEAAEAEAAEETSETEETPSEGEETENQEG